MSKLGKLRKNAEKYNLDNFYNNMTPEQYKSSIRIAVQEASQELTKEYNRKLYKMRDEFNKYITDSVHITMDTFSIEFLYEVANELECFIEEPENLEQKIDLVQRIYKNIMQSIQNYVEIKSDGKAYEEFKRKKDLIQKVFNIYKQEEK